MIRTHISIPNCTDRLIKEYCEKNKMRYSQAVDSLIELGSDNIDLNLAIDRNNKAMDHIYGRLGYIVNLLEHMIADFDMECDDNQNKSRGVLRVRNKTSKYKFDD